MPLPKDKMTASEFFEKLPETNELCELIEGQVVMQAAPTTVHQDIVGGLYSEIRGYIRRNGGGCKPFIAPTDVVLDSENVVQPDVFIVCDPSKVDDKRVNGVPDMVIEVVSTNRNSDFSRKLKLYKDHGVREYWIVDPNTERTVVYLFGENNIIEIYTFDQAIPVGIYGGDLTVTIDDIM